MPLARVLLILLALASALAGCDGFGPNDVTVELPGASADAEALRRAPEWTLVAATFEGRSYDVARSRYGPYTVRFGSDGVVGGRISANTYAGQYAVGADGALSTDRIYQTLIGESEGAQEIASAMLGVLGRAERFEATGCVLQVFSDRGALRFGTSCYDDR